MGCSTSEIPKTLPHIGKVLRGFKFAESVTPSKSLKNHISAEKIDAMIGLHLDAFK